MKEPNYYWSEGRRDWPAATTRDAYERLFDDVTSERAIGEASSQYLNSATAPDRITADLPRVKLIVSLRKPADRAYSSYLGRLRGGRERRGVEEAMQPGTYYLTSSLYHQALSRYFQRFDRRRIKVIVFEDLAADPHAVVRGLLEFLEVDSTIVADVATTHNAGSVPRALLINEILCKTAQIVRNVLPPAMRETGLAARAQRLLLSRPDPLPAAIRRRLLDGFRDDIARTGALIGRDLSHWLN